MADFLQIPQYGIFKLIRPLVGFHKAMEAQIQRFPYSQNVFLMMKFRRENALLSDYIIDQLQRHNFRGVRADDPGWNITRNTYNPVAVLYCCRFGLALFDEPEETQAYSPNVAYELGMMHYQDKNCLILRHTSLPSMPFDLIKDLYVPYSNDLEVRHIIESWINSIRDEAVRFACDNLSFHSTLLSDVIDFSTLPLSVRRYLRGNGIMLASDASRIDFDNMLLAKNIGKVSVSNLLKQLMDKGILDDNDEYLKRFIIS